MHTDDQSVFVICPRKMQNDRCLRGLLSLALVLLLSDCLITNINTHPTQTLNPWTRPPPPLSSDLVQTRRTASGVPISYRLDAWSQYDNPEEGTEREGDIHETLETRKTFTTDKSLLWHDGIVYYFVHSSIVNEPMKLAILEDALNIIMSKTCIKFVRIYPEEYEKLPVDGWVNITGHQRGCFSDLGRIANEPNNLNLDVDNCFRTIGHAMHEMLHTLGVYHEHMRPDRDNYITILWENIREEDSFNFRILDKNTVTDYGLPYDYDSIMHYSMTAFSINRTIPTIVSTKPDVEIGQRSHLSKYDIQKVLITYNCNTINIKNSKPNNKKPNNKKPNNKEPNNKKPNNKKPNNKEPNNKKPNNKKPNVTKNKKCKRLKLSKQNEIILKTKMERQAPILTLHNSVSNKLKNNEYANSGRRMNEFKQIAFPTAMPPVQSNYYPVPLSPMYPYINFYFYFLKN